MLYRTFWVQCFNQQFERYILMALRINIDLLHVCQKRLKAHLWLTIDTQHQAVHKKANQCFQIFVLTVRNRGRHHDVRLLTVARQQSRESAVQNHKDRRLFLLRVAFYLAG